MKIYKFSSFRNISIKNIDNFSNSMNESNIMNKPNVNLILDRFNDIMNKYFNKNLPIQGVKSEHKPIHHG